MLFTFPYPHASEDKPVRSHPRGGDAQASHTPKEQALGASGEAHRCCSAWAYKAKTGGNKSRGPTSLFNTPYLNTEGRAISFCSPRFLWLLYVTVPQGPHPVQERSRPLAASGSCREGEERSEAAARAREAHPSIRGAAPSRAPASGKPRATALPRL